MATKTFSGRAEERKLAMMEALAQEQYGMSFGQFCSTVLVDYAAENGRLPSIRPKKTKGKKGIATMLRIASKHGRSDISALSDEQIKDLIASRYE